MTNKPIIPIFRGEAECMLSESRDAYFCHNNPATSVKIGSNFGRYFSINEVKISLDNGLNFYRMEQIKDAIYLYEQAMEDNEATNFPVNNEGL